MLNILLCVLAFIFPPLPVAMLKGVDEPYLSALSASKPIDGNQIMAGLRKYASHMTLEGARLLIRNSPDLLLSMSELVWMLHPTQADVFNVLLAFYKEHLGGEAFLTRPVKDFVDPLAYMANSMYAIPPHVLSVFLNTRAYTLDAFTYAFKKLGYYRQDSLKFLAKHFAERGDMDVFRIAKSEFELQLMKIAWIQGRIPVIAETVAVVDESVNAPVVLAAIIAEYTALDPSDVWSETAKTFAAKNE